MLLGFFLPKVKTRTRALCVGHSFWRNNLGAPEIGAWEEWTGRIENHPRVNYWPGYSCRCCCWVASVVSDSVRSHCRQPTRLRHPWDSPGKNTGVGCHFLLQCRKVKSESEVTLLCPTLSNPMDCSLPGFSIHGIFQARVLEWGAIAFSRKTSYRVGKNICKSHI